MREYKSALLAECGTQKWARPGTKARYRRPTHLIGQQVADGEWKAGERMPYPGHLAARYVEKQDTVARALYILTVRGQLTLETGAYYVPPRGLAL